MKVIIIIVQLVFTALTGFSQKINGNYQHFNINGQPDKEYIKFYNDSLDFSLQSGGCITTTYQGRAHYTVKNTRIFITPEYIRKIPSIVKSLSEDSTTMTIHITGGDSVGVSCIVYNGKDFKGGSQSDANGNIKLSKKLVNTGDRIILRMIGYIETILPIENSQLFNYTIKMNQGPSPDELKDFITNQGDGIKFRLNGNILKLKYGINSCNRKAPMWFTFEKNDGTGL